MPNLPKTKLPPFTLKKGLILVLIIVFLVVVSAVALFLLTREKIKPDKIGPEIQLSSPSSENWYSTNTKTIAIEGLVNDESGVKSVTWKSDKGKSGTATISEDSWKIEGVSLSNKDNKITITAVDEKGNISEVVFNVVYNSNVTFHDITLSQDYLFVEEPADVTIRAEIEAESSTTIGDVNLYQVTGDKTKKLVEMLDNGIVDNGDDIPGDGVFSGINSFSATSAKQIQLRVGVASSESSEISYSEVITISVFNRLSEAQLSKVVSINKEINTKFEEIKKSKSGQDAAEELVRWLSEKEEIKLAGTSDEGLGVWWEYKDTGILGGIENNPEGTRGSEEERAKIRNREVQARQKSGSVAGVSDTIFSTVNFGVPKASAQTTGPEVKSTKALYLGPYLHDFKDTDDYHDAWQTIKDSKCPECQTVEKKDAEVTIEDFKNLSDYGLVVIISHGDSWFNGVFGTDRGQVVILTFQSAGENELKKYEADLRLRRLALTGGNKLVVLPQFVRRYNRNFPSSLVYVGSCRSSYNATMSNVFRSKGAKAYFGFSEYVLSDYAKDVAGEMMKSFINKGKAAAEAFQEAVNAKGADDGQATPARFTFSGDQNLKMGGKKLQNTGFEENLLGWQSEGDARIILSLASLTPQEGKKMAIISTGLGSVNDSNSALIQVICSQEGKATISFKYNVVSEEPMEWVDSAYDDNFTMSVDVNGKKTTVVQVTINNSSWIPIGGIDFAGGDATTYMTGWKTASLDLEELKKDDRIQIEFRVSDKGDSIYDTAALIDTVNFEVK